MFSPLFILLHGLNDVFQVGVEDEAKDLGSKSGHHVDASCHHQVHGEEEPNVDHLEVGGCRETLRWVYDVFIFVYLLI